MMGPRQQSLGPSLWFLWADKDMSMLGNPLNSVSWKVYCVGGRGLRGGGGEGETRSFGPAIEGYS